MIQHAARWMPILCLGAACLCGQTAPAPPAPTAEQIGQWIQDLGANQFDVRDRATQALIGAGGAAIEPALKATQGKDREVALRSVVVLQEIGARGDTDTLQSALGALERASQRSPSPIVVRQATEAMGSLMAVRQERAIELLRMLGASIYLDPEDRWYQQAARLAFAPPVFVVEFGPQWRGEDKDLERLSWISDIEQVNFVGPQVKDSWFRYLRNLPKLHSVKVKRANITNQGLAELTQVEGIWFLRLMFVPLDDSAVPLLENAKGLRRLLFISRALSEKGVADLQQHFGKDNIECPKGALLGITANTAEGEKWTVASVLAGSAAEKAGILENDRIVKYNGQPITDFLSLRNHIARNEPGDSATLEVERGLERLTKQVTFGEWD